MLPFFLEAKGFKVGISLDNVLTDRWLREVEIIKHDVKAAGGEVVVMAALSNHHKQVTQVQELVDHHKINVLVIVAVDGNQAKEAVDYAVDRKVKVIAYDRMIKDCHLDYHITFDGVEIGELQAQYAIEKRPTGNYLVFHGPISDMNTGKIKQGQHRIMRGKIEEGEIRVVKELYLRKWSKLEAYRMMQQIYAQNNQVKVDAIIAANDMIAEGVIEFLKEREIEDVVVTGLDAELKACKRIVKGEQSMTVYGDHNKLAHYAASLAADLGTHHHLHHHLKEERLVHNGKEKIPTVELHTEVIDTENIDKMLVDRHIFPKEVVYK